jgi:Ser-tRNA(Ala) deacylase AlaX
MTTPLYLNDTYLFNSEAAIINTGADEKGHFVLLDQTIFYPQGGGQPSDQGEIKNDYFSANVILVRQLEHEIRHYINLSLNEIPNQSKVACCIDSNRRLLNSRYHTAAHLLGNIVEILYPEQKAVKGHSFPKEAYVEFQGDVSVDTIAIQNALNEAIAKKDKIQIFEIDPQSFEQQFYKLPYSIPENKKFRAMQIGNMLPIPCGGTHLSCVGEIGKMVLGKIKPKNNLVRIYYDVI